MAHDPLEQLMYNSDTPNLIIERLDGATPTGEIFQIFEPNVKLIFKGMGKHCSIPIWVIKDAIDRYNHDPANIAKNNS